MNTELEIIDDCFFKFQPDRFVEPVEDVSRSSKTKLGTYAFKRLCLVSCDWGKNFVAVAVLQELNEVFLSNFFVKLQN